jgi:hypothetical protein
MPLEDAQFIDQLNPLWPLGTDGLNQSDDQHRVIKQAVQQSFPNIDKEVTATADDLNTLTGAATLGSGLNPMGTVIQGAWTAAPNGYLDCDGAAIDPQYADLIALVGPNTPDLRGQFVRGWSQDSSVDPDGPRLPLTEQLDEFKSHVHGVQGIQTSSPNGQTGPFVGNSGAVTYNRDSLLEGGAETRPVNTALLYAIKW